VRTKRSANAFALGESHRRADCLDPAGSEHLVERCRELRVLVADEKAEPTSGVFEVRGEVARHLGDPGHGRVGGHPEQVNDAAVYFDAEQDVVAPERHRVDVEEVGRQDPLGLSGEELRPGRSFTPWCWGKPVSAEHGGDARLGHGDAELAQFSDDA